MKSTFLCLAFIATIIATASSAAETPRQFDLACTGITDGYPNNYATASRYHVDLEAQQWCSDECVMNPVAKEDPDVIWFRKHDPAFAGDLQVNEYVNRTTGQWLKHMGPLRTNGVCVPEPFSGFPAAAAARKF